MAVFLQSRVGRHPADEILEQNQLTIAGLRSLIPGDFHLEQFDEKFILFHEKGIFILKQCHRNGIIFGSEGQKFWTDLNYLGEGTDFPNPLLDNQTTMDKLADILKLPVATFCSVILFDTQCELRNVPTNNRRCGVLRVDQLEEYFAESLPPRPACYTHTQLEALHDIFLLVSTVG